MKKYPKPKIDSRNQPEYWSKDYPPEFISNDDYVYPKIYSIDNIEEKVIYLHWLSEEYLPKNISDQWRFYFSDVASEVDEQLRELKQMMGNKRFYAVQKQDDFKIKNEYYNSQIKMSIILYPREATLVQRMIKFIGPKDFIYLKAMDIFYSEESKTYTAALNESIKRFRQHFPNIQCDDNDFTKWRKRHPEQVTP